MAKRKPIPEDVRNQVLVDAMHRCCLCPEHQEVVDLHHVVPISEDGPNTADNLMAVCPTCHAKIHRIRNRYTADQLRTYKERWVRLCALGLPLDLRIAQAFDVTKPPEPPQMPPGIPAPPAPYLAHPYPAQEHFTGRDAERADLTAWLAGDAHPLLAVIAIGGMGKSALAWHWLRNDVGPLGFEHWDLRGALWWCFYDRESGFERFLERGIAYASGGEMDASRWPVRDCMECLCKLLAERRFLLVLDGVERLLRAYARMDAPYLGDEEAGDDRCAEPNVATFLQWLAGLEATKTLLTSRLLPRELDGLAGVARRDLTQMDPDDAVRFFHAAGVQGTRAEIQAACAPYGYLPLALRLLAGLVIEDPARPGDIAVASDYEITEDLRGKEHHHILERAYNALDPAPRDLLSRIAAFRAPVGYDTLSALFGPHPSPGGEAATLSPLPDGRGEGAGGWGEGFPTEHALKDALRGLVRRGLLSRQGEAARYDLHPVVRRYAYDRLADKEGTHTRLRDYFAAVPQPEKIESLDDLAATIELYHHTVRAGRYDEAYQLFRGRLDQPTYYRFGAYGLQTELLRGLFPDGEDKLPRLSTEAGQASALNDLFAVYAMSGQPGRAVPLSERHIAIRERQDVKKGVAVGLANLATQYLAIGALAAAEEALRRAIEIYVGFEDRGNEASLHQELGRLLALEANSVESENELNLSMKYHKAMEGSQPEISKGWQGRVWAYRALRALPMGRALTLPPAAGAATPSPLPISGEGRGSGGEERAPDALEAARRARELADVERVERDIIRAEWLLGAVQRARGELAQAQPHLDEALRRCRRINLVELEPDILLEMARVVGAQAARRRFTAALGGPAALGDLAALREASPRASGAGAAALAREALSIADRCGYRLKQADCHNFLARLALEEGNRDEARQHATIARDRAECDGPPHRYETAFQEAERLLREIGG